MLQIILDWNLFFKKIHKHTVSSFHYFPGFPVHVGTMTNALVVWTYLSWIGHTTFPLFGCAQITAFFLNEILFRLWSSYRIRSPLIKTIVSNSCQSHFRRDFCGSISFLAKLISLNPWMPSLTTVPTNRDKLLKWPWKLAQRGLIFKRCDTFAEFKDELWVIFTPHLDLVDQWSVSLKDVRRFIQWDPT